jgi:hypothetical protein
MALASIWGRSAILLLRAVQPMFTVRWTHKARETYDQLKAKAEASLSARKSKGKSKSTKDEGLFKQVHKCLEWLRKNPRHSGLNTHAYSSMENPFDKNEKVWEAYAQNQTPGAYRVFWCYGPGKRELTVLAITPHP